MLQGHISERDGDAETVCPSTFCRAHGELLGQAAADTGLNVLGFQSPHPDSESPLLEPCCQSPKWTRCSRCINTVLGRLIYLYNHVT